MTNPDNVGGLPERWRGLADKCEAEFPQKAQIFRWCANELCRAAPAGGECQHEWQPDADVMNARYCPKCDVTQTLPRKQPKDSAPAGSGEVSDGYEKVCAMELARLRERDKVETMATYRGDVWYWQGDGHDMPETLACPVIMSADTLRALLRKLQQGADAAPQECPYCFRCDCLGSCKYGLAGNGAASQGREGV